MEDLTTRYCLAKDCLLLPAKGLHGGPGCLLLLAQGVGSGIYNLEILTGRCSEDPYYFCLSTSYMKDMVANMNYNLVVLALPCRDMGEELYCNKMVVLVPP